MINVHEAIKRAKDYALSVLGQDLQNLLVEGVDSSDKEWQIILGFDPRTESSGVAITLGDTVKREYKRFDVDKNTGDVKSMHIQPVA